MGINHEAILKQQAHVGSLLKVRVCPHKPCQHGIPQGTQASPPSSYRQHIQYLTLKSHACFGNFPELKSAAFLTNPQCHLFFFPLKSEFIYSAEVDTILYFAATLLPLQRKLQHAASFCSVVVKMFA